MKNKNKEYWEKRQLAREELSFNKGTEAYKEYVKILSESKKGIENKIAQLYAKYQQEVTKLGIDKIQANKLLRGTEYKEWRHDIGKYVAEIEKLKKSNPVEFRKMSVELETLAYRSRISRLDSLKAGVDYELIQAGEKIKGKVTDTLADVYEDTYTSFVEDLNFKKGVISSSTIKMALEQEWSGDNYSSRIWSNIDNLAKAIKNEVIVGLNRGINYRTMSQNIAKKFDTSYKNAERLVRTETAHIQNQATLMGYKDSGVVKYEFLAVLDSRTSHTCASLNGEVFKTENAMEGENYPPMHPNCRSTTVPYEYSDVFSDEAEKEDFENNENEGIINNNGTVFVEGGKYRNIGNINATEYKDEPLELLRRYEQKIVKKSKENALVIAKNGDIYILKGDENSIPSHKMTKINFEDALYTHNHPKNSNHEWGFSNDDFSSFTNLKLKYLAAIDEKYIHELCSEIYDVKKHLERVEIYIKNPNELLKLNDEERNRILQLYFASEKNLRYRRFNHGY
ncbi:MAG: minor capsid protein [Leptotrichia wadei]|uniref:minor capsid protein n=1 Tax=Leptotrichia wadei TaxID=157687 RepID=UPI0026EA18C0|nr:minor capsid protein [Leptotrichia wadei]MBS6019594.1 minor capsid protein [Leptotrichia wadei]